MLCDWIFYERDRDRQTEIDRDRERTFSNAIHLLITINKISILFV